METTTKLEGKFARLPDGQKVRIESREDNIAVVVRIEGPRRGTRAVCATAKLQPILSGDTQRSHL